MKELIDYMDIPLLIVKQMNGEISREELERLEIWLAEDVSHLRLYEKIRSREGRSNREKNIALFNRRTARNYVERNTGNSRSIAYYGKIVAAVLLPLLFVGLFLYRLNSPEKVEYIIAERIIGPGGQKAELILGNGKKIALEQEMQQELARHGIQLEESGGIVYREVDQVDHSSYNRLIVPSGGEFQVTLSDGSIVFLNSESELRYPVMFKGDKRKVYLIGEGYFEVNRNEDKPFIVEMEQMRIEVLGTAFNARSYADEQKTYTTLVSGSVRLENDHSVLLLKPGEQGFVDEQGILGSRVVDVSLHTAWKDGDFVFRKQRLEDIMRVVARWYDVKVVFLDAASKEVTFSGNMRRYEGFDKLTEMLEFTGSVRFELNRDTILIHKAEPLK